MNTLDDLINYVRIGFSIEDVEGKNLYSLLRLDQNDKSMLEYTQEFNSSYAWWKKSIDIKAAVYMYIGGLKNGALRADLMTNWQTGKYATITALQTDAAKNAMWRNTSAYANGSGNGDRKSKGSNGSSPGYNGNGNNNGSGSRNGSSNEKGSSNRQNNGKYSKSYANKDKWAKIKTDPNAKAPVDKSGKRKVSFSDTNNKGFDQWNKAKSKLTEEEFNKRRRTFACINCGEVGHKFADCTKPKTT
jgi:hypothetical protein